MYRLLWGVISEGKIEATQLWLDDVALQKKGDSLHEYSAKNRLYRAGLLLNDVWLQKHGFFLQQAFKHEKNPYLACFLAYSEGRQLNSLLKAFVIVKASQSQWLTWGR